MREGLWGAGKVISKIDAVVRVKEKYSVGCTGPTSDDTGMDDVRDIYTHPSPSQLKEKFIVPCFLRRTG